MKNTAENQKGSDGEKWIWAPNIGLGPIILGSPIKPYLETGLLQIKQGEYPNEIGMIDYKVSNYDIHISSNAEDPIEMVVSILCYDYFFYNGVNLIGKSIEDTVRILGFEYDKVDTLFEFEDGEVLTDYEFDKYNLYVTISERTKKVYHISIIYDFPDD